MKKFVGVILAFLSSGMAYALPLGNPAEASLLYEGIVLEGLSYNFCQTGVSWSDAFSFRFGYYGDFVFDRHLQTSYSVVTNGHKHHAKIEQTSLFTNAAYLAGNFWNRVDLFATFGGTNFSLCTNAFTFGGAAGNRFDLDADNYFSWSVGGRLTFYKCGATFFGTEIQYFSTKPHITRVSIEEANSIYPNNTIHLKYHEGQWGIGVASRIWNLIPYCGAKVSWVYINFGDARLNISGTDYLLHNLEHRFNGGYVIGVTYTSSDKISLTIEARYPDEKAFYVNGQMRF